MSEKVQDDWDDDDDPPISMEEKMEIEAEDPVMVIRKTGQFLIYPDGREEEILPDDPRYNHHTRQ